MPLHDLLGVGDNAGPGPDPLRAIVARAGRRRRRMAAGGMAVALVVGGAVGYALSNHSHRRPRRHGVGAGRVRLWIRGSLAAGVRRRFRRWQLRRWQTGAGSSGAARARPIGARRATGSLTRLFTRTTAAGVTLRAFRTAPPIPACPVRRLRSRRAPTPGRGVDGRDGRHDRRLRPGDPLATGDRR